MFFLDPSGNARDQGIRTYRVAVRKVSVALRVHFVIDGIVMTPLIALHSP
jgi:hypothetical protein